MSPEVLKKGGSGLEYDGKVHFAYNAELFQCTI